MTFVESLGMTQPGSTAEERPLISEASILILSTFLVGVSIGRSMADETSALVLSCGLVGCLSYFVFQWSRMRRERATHQTERRLIERRLDRHVTGMLLPGAERGDPQFAAPLREIDALLRQT